MHKENWDDLRFALAVADHGSVSAAARVLGVNHATVLRRVAALEKRFGASLFTKTQQGYSVAPHRMQVFQAIREVDAAIMGVNRVFEGAQSPLRGVVKVTSTDTFCFDLLPDIIADLRKSAKDLRIDLVSSNAHLDMRRLAADITVRPANGLPDDLVGTVAAKLGFAVFAAPDGADGWLGLSGDISRSLPAQWLAKAVPADQIIASGDSFRTLTRMAVAGMGRVILPNFIAEPEEGLVALPDAAPKMAVDIWVASHVDLVDVPRIRAVRDFLIEAISKRADALEGSF